MKILELFSGIGGMHFAFKKSCVKGEIICSIEINPLANKVYSQNFPQTALLNRNIENLTAEFIEKLQVDTIFMSPPCQPFTRNGLQGDVNDPRTNAFLHILNIIPNTSINCILIENVKGFETSEMREKLLKVLKELCFNIQEFILSPTQFGIPNTRHRYYCLAKKFPKTNNFGEIMTEFPEGSKDITPFPLSRIVENNSQKYKLSEKILKKYFSVIDICSSDSNRSCCFTKGYSRYIHGTGSVYSDKTELEVKKVVNNVKKSQFESNEEFDQVKQLNLRFFSPKEVSRLMCFPESFVFPQEISDKQKYMMLGNSVNITVVSELIKKLNEL